MIDDISPIRQAQIEAERGDTFFTELDDLIANHLDSGTSLKDIVCWLHVTQTAMTSALMEAVYEDEE